MPLSRNWGNDKKIAENRAKNVEIYVFGWNFFRNNAQSLKDSVRVVGKRYRCMQTLYSICAAPIIIAI